jgi:hypothetical protein
MPPKPVVVGSKPTGPEQHAGSYTCEKIIELALSIPSSLAAVKEGIKSINNRRGSLIVVVFYTKFLGDKDLFSTNWGGIHPISENKEESPGQRPLSIGSNILCGGRTSIWFLYCVCVHTTNTLSTHIQLPSHH